MPASTYRELLPHQALRADMVCFWTQVIGGGEGAHGQRILPDGCIDLIWIGDAAPVVVGPATRPATVQLPARTRICGARFRPGRATRLLRTNASALRDREVPLADLIRDVADLASSVGGLPTLQRVLARQLQDARAGDDTVAHGVRWLAHHPAGRIHELGHLLGLSPRQLQRRFTDTVGYGPKTLQRILRLQLTLTLATTGPRSVAGLALDAGYADQAHMSRELALLGGATATRLVATASSALAMSDLFKNDPNAPATLVA